MLEGPRTASHSVPVVRGGCAMRWSRMITVVGAHAEGEVGRVITGGVIDVPGKTMLEKMRHLNTTDDRIRRFALLEPRGAAQMSANLLLPPARAGADAGFLVMQADGCHAMSGSNAMCVTTVLLETGMLPMVEPVTRVVLDTPAGLVAAEAACQGGRCERVTLEFVPSFVEQLARPLEVEGVGTLRVDVAYGGDYFCLVDAGACGFRVTPDEARDMVALGRQIRRAARRQIPVRHPEIADLREISFVMFCAGAPGGPEPPRNGTVIHPGRLDRSPCGTGTAARLAVMQAKGELGLGQPIEMRSVIDSSFRAEIVSTTTVGDRPAIVPRISGRAWIYGVCQLGLDPSDPYPLGYTLADTWGPDAA
jgi:proline racemase